MTHEKGYAHREQGRVRNEEEHCPVSLKNKEKPLNTLHHKSKRPTTKVVGLYI